MADSIWWTKMLHKEDFCEHFCEMSDKEIVDDIRKSIASFMKQREEGEDFGAKMVHKAKLRIDAVHDVRSDAGKQGGRPRKEEQGAVAIDSSKGKKSAQAGSHNTGTALVPASEPLWGEFQNVEISQDQFNELAQYVGNVEECKKLINSFSANIADGTVTSKNHFATLKKWADARKRFVEKNEKAEANNTMSFQEIEGQRQVAQLRKYGLIK